MHHCYKTIKQNTLFILISLINHYSSYMKKLVISSGAGISAESGITTFRDAGGLWENYPVMKVASADGFRENPALIHEFYNNRRDQLQSAQPNAAHLILKELEKDFDVQVITQNVDNLHEKAGSSKVLHLHGELMKVRSMKNPNRIYELKEPNLHTSIDTSDEYGDPVRPHIVFFQEDVPNFQPAVELAQEADIFVVIGTSLVVYPAASLLYYVRPGIPIFYIDPNPAQVPSDRNITVIPKKATEGMAELAALLKDYK